VYGLENELSPPAGGRLTLHTNNSLASVQLGRSFSSLQNLLNPGSNKRIQFITKRVSKHGMNHQTLAPEESLLSNSFSPIDDLVRNDEMSRNDFFPQ
jgi:hypothetical protein